MVYYVLAVLPMHTGEYMLPMYFQYQVPWYWYCRLLGYLMAMLPPELVRGLVEQQSKVASSGVHSSMTRI
jgi:hypothetical protein